MPVLQLDQHWLGFVQVEALENLPIKPLSVDLKKIDLAKMMPSNEIIQPDCRNTYSFEIPDVYSEMTSDDDVEKMSI